MNTQSIIKRIAPHVGALVAFILVVAIYFAPQFNGKVLYQSDLIQFKAMTKEVMDIEKEYGERPLWTNAMFGGMPTYQLGAKPKGNYLSVVLDAMRLWIGDPAGWFLLAMITSYLLFITIGIKPLLASVASICYGLSTYHLFVYEAGHITYLSRVV